ncbi:MAG: TetR/AcrR family transcriptional regulator [Actinomycetota bacterium]|nr:TetR/AcrR family transcriptional regulator [Actinomycetota bacterium]
MAAAGPSANDRRNQIIDAAMTAFAAKNYNAASMADIAGEAGITKRAIYRYFPSKRDLFYAVRNKVYKSIVEELWIKMPPSDNIIELAESLMRSHIEFSVKHPEMSRIVINTISEAASREFQANIEALLQDRADEIEGLIRSGIEEGYVDPNLDPRFVAWMIVMLFFVLIYLHAGKEDPLIPQDEDAVAVVMHPFLESLAPRRAEAVTRISSPRR